MSRGQRDLITVVGHAATIGAGEFVQASGRWVNDRTQASSSAAISWALPTAVEGIEKYVASRMWCRSDVAKPSTSTFFLMLSRVSGSRDAEGQVPRNLQASPQQLREQQHDAKAS